MQQMIGLSNPVAWVMCLICILGVGFMIRFLGALIAEEKKSRARLSLRLNSLRDSRSGTFAEPLRTAYSAPPVAHFTQKLANFGPVAESGRPVATFEISGRL